jgi:hypothetical protein
MLALQKINLHLKGCSPFPLLRKERGGFSRGEVLYLIRSSDLLQKDWIFFKLQIPYTKYKY